MGDIDEHHSDAREDPLLGQVLDGRYSIIERIGAGGMGAVYRARQATIERDVAVKVLSHEASHDESLVKRFKNEARIISELRHPNTLKLIDFGHTGDRRLYLVTELLLGEPLDRMLSRGAISVEQTVSFLKQIAESLNEAHAKGIVHRDLKPGNIFIETVEGQHLVKVLDFGIAKLSHQSTATRTGTVFGTPAYMSPEQARGEKVDARSDLYGLGVIAYECLSGARPFHADTPLGLLFKHVHEAPVSLSERVGLASVPAELASLVMKLLEKHPDDRPPSASELRTALIMIERRLSEGPPAPLPIAKPASPERSNTLDSMNWASSSIDIERRSSRRTIAIVAIACAGALGTWAYSLFPSMQERMIETTPLPVPAPPVVKTATTVRAAITERVEEKARSVRIESTPAGTAIVDVATSALLGFAPLAVDVPEGSRRSLRVESRGYLAKVIVVDDRAAEVHVSLERRAPERNIEATKPAAPDGGVQEQPVAPWAPLKKDEVTTW